MPTEGANADFFLADLRTRTGLPVSRDLWRWLVPALREISFFFWFVALPGTEYQMVSPRLFGVSVS